jgi:hypothetical protein
MGPLNEGERAIVPSYCSYIHTYLICGRSVLQTAISMLLNVLLYSTVKKLPKSRWNHGILALAVAHSEHEGFGNVRE